MTGPPDEHQTGVESPASGPLSSRRRLVGTLAVLSMAGLAGCTGDDEPADGDDGDEQTPAEPDPEAVEAVVRVWVEATTDEELADIIHPESSFVPAAADDEWELSRVKDVDFMGDEEAFVEYSSQRKRDGVYNEATITLRRHEGEWLVYD